mgnify:CR=1 FL=1
MKFISVTTTLLLFTLAPTTELLANNRAHCSAFYFSGQYEYSIEPCTSAAEQGSSRSQFILGEMYENGLGVERDYTEAVRWYSAAADQGYAVAQRRLDGMYYDRALYSGDHVDCLKYCETGEYDSALVSCVAAAEQGFEVAQFRLGELYQYGHGVEQDISESVRWYRASAAQGYAEAQYKLGMFYRMGFGVTQSFLAAVGLYRAAAEQGHDEAQNNLGIMYDNGLGVEQDYAEAVRWYRAAAEQGYALAQNNLGIMYENGLGVEQDHIEAVRWYRAAAVQEDEIAQRNLGIMYELGLGVAQNYILSHAWYYIAATNGAGVSAVQGRDRTQELLTTRQVTQAQVYARKCMNVGYSGC